MLEDYDEREDDGMPWEDEAEEAVKQAIEEAELDDVRAAVVIRNDGNSRGVSEYSSFDELCRDLSELYDEVWYAHVPFDGGEAVFESDAIGHVSDLLSDLGIAEFFDAMQSPDAGDALIQSRELVGSPKESRVLRVELADISAELVEYFAKHPEKLYEMDPFKFEDLMAAVFRDRGFEVTQTPRTRDGGVDLILLKRSDFGQAMTLVDCKRYAPKKKIGVQLVRAMYGVVEKQRATGGLIVTTSHFTKDAIAEREQLKYRMDLADFEDIKRFLEEWRTGRNLR